MKNANTVSLLFAGLLICCAGGCGRVNDAASSAGPPAAAAPLKTVADHFDISVGGRTVHMQVAVSEPEEERGLMERRDLGADEGMIFMYRSPQRMNFWMHDTPTALDVGFFTPDGVLAEIYPMYPYDEKTVSSRGDNLQFALEMRQGWYGENGVKTGARLDLRSLAAALKARGFDPGAYGITP